MKQKLLLESQALRILLIALPVLRSHAGSRVCRWGCPSMHLLGWRRCRLLLLHGKVLRAGTSLIHVAIHTSKGASCAHGVVHGWVTTHGSHLRGMHGRLLSRLLELSHVMGLGQGRGLRLRRWPHLALLEAVRRCLLAHGSHSHRGRCLVHLR